MSQQIERERCYKCMRPKTSCFCASLRPIEPKTRFVILMHPKEFRKEKNGTGRMAHRQLINSHLFVDVDFTDHKQVNKIINDENNSCYVLYPSNKSINLSETTEPFALNRSREKFNYVFVLDGTWPCAKKIFKLSKNLHKIPTISFDNDAKSQFLIKQQPYKECLSTIESILKVINLLKVNGEESCKTDHFLQPFHAMVHQQIKCILNPPDHSYRPNKTGQLKPKANYKKNSKKLIYSPK